MFEVLEEPSARKPVELESSEQGQVVRYEAREVSRAGATRESLCRAKKGPYLTISRVLCSPMPRTGEEEACEKPRDYLERTTVSRQEIIAA